MFKFVVLFAVCVACACAADSRDVYAVITNYQNQIDPEGQYQYLYETSNGIAAQERGLGGEFASGGFSYFSPEGELIQTAYNADQNGFQPQGAHLPTPPPIPAAILRSLEYIRTHPSAEQQRRN